MEKVTAGKGQRSHQGRKVRGPHTVGILRGMAESMGGASYGKRSLRKLIGGKENGICHIK